MIHMYNRVNLIQLISKLDALIKVIGQALQLVLRVWLLELQLFDCEIGRIPHN